MLHIVAMDENSIIQEITNAMTALRSGTITAATYRARMAEIRATCGDDRAYDAAKLAAVKADVRRIGNDD